MTDYEYIIIQVKKFHSKSNLKWASTGYYKLDDISPEEYDPFN